MSLDSLIAALAEFAPTLGAFLLAYLVHSTVLFALAWGLTSRRVGLPVHVREYVWKGAVFGGVLTALVVTAFPAWRPSIVVPRFMQKSAPVIAQTPTPRLVEVRAPQTMSISSMPATERFSRLASPAPAVASVTPSPITFEVVQVPPPAPRNIPAGVWLSGAFLALAGLGLARLTFERARLSRTLGERLPVVGGPLARMFEELSADANLAGEVHLTQSHRLPTPVAIGAAEVCIPEGVLEMLPRAEQRCILAHELAHLIRRDPTWRMALRALESVFFFQPLNRVARARIQELAEFACDDYAAQNTQEGGIMMARSLASAAQWIESIQAPALAAALTRPESPLVQRVERLLAGPESRNLSQRQRALVVFASASFAILGAVAPTFAADEPTPPPAAPAAPETPEASEAPEAPRKTRVFVRRNGKDTETPVPSNASTIAVGKNGKVSVVSTSDAPNAVAYVYAGEDGDAPQVYAFSGGDATAAFAPNALFNTRPMGKRPAIGVVLRDTDEALASQLGISADTTVVLGDISADSAAEKAGLKKHDIVLKINGEDATSDNIRRIISETKVGERVELSILRAGQPQAFSVEVEERDDSGSFLTSYAFAGAPGAPARLFAFDNEHLDKLRAELAELNADPEATAESRRELELALERAQGANTFFPPEMPQEELARFEATMAKLQANEAFTEAKLARLQALEGLTAIGIPPMPPIASSMVKDRFIEGVAADIANRLTKRDSSLNWEKLNELAKAAVQNSIGQVEGLTETVTCTNGECSGSLSVDTKELSTAVTRELRASAADAGFADNAKIEKWLADEVTDAVRANNNKKTTWTN